MGDMGSGEEDADEEDSTDVAEEEWTEVSGKGSEGGCWASGAGTSSSGETTICGRGGLGAA